MAVWLIIYLVMIRPSSVDISAVTFLLEKLLVPIWELATLLSWRDNYGIIIYQREIRSFELWMACVFHFLSEVLYPYLNAPHVISYLKPKKVIYNLVLSLPLGGKNLERV